MPRGRVGNCGWARGVAGSGRDVPPRAGRISSVHCPRPAHAFNRPLHRPRPSVDGFLFGQGDHNRLVYKSLNTGELSAPSKPPSAPQKSYPRRKKAIRTTEKAVRGTNQSIRATDNLVRAIKKLSALLKGPSPAEPSFRTQGGIPEMSILTTSPLENFSPAGVSGISPVGRNDSARAWLTSSRQFLYFHFPNSPHPPH